MAELKCYECYLFDSKEKTWTLEIWSSSTKYPDTKFYFSDFKLIHWVDKEHQVFQWLLECASKMNSPIIAKEIVEYALENFVTWENKG